MGGNRMNNLTEYAAKIHDATRWTIANDDTNDMDADLAVDVAIRHIRTSDTVYFIGNGGSLAACAHMANDLSLAHKRAIDLGSAANITCIGNDFGFENIFNYQLKWQFNAAHENLIIALSCSGNSKNVINAVEAFRDKAKIITFTGFDKGNALRKLGHLNFHVPSNSYGVVQLAHEALLHCIIDKFAGLY
jgi:D-sedoheptulose 7-phosphate isomerase